MTAVPSGNDSTASVVRRFAMFSRRAFLTAAAGLPLSARAFGDASRFVPAVVKHGGRWDARASGLRRLAWELQRRTSVEVQLEARPIALDSPRLFEHPFLYLSSDGPFPAFSAAEVEALRRYLTFGGFLFADANDGSDGAGFDASFRRELARVLPQAPLTALPSTHVILGVDKKGNENFQLSLGGSEAEDVSLANLTGPGFDEDGVIAAVEKVTDPTSPPAPRASASSIPTAGIGMEPFKEALYG